MNTVDTRLLNLFMVYLGVLLILEGCSSTKATLKFESLKYPTSMSAFLYDQQDHVIMKDKELETLHSFVLKKTFWSIGYGLIPLTSEGAISDSLNALVDMFDGDGILNLSITIDQGIVNKIYSFLLYIPSLIPIFPSSASITIKGEIVKLLVSGSSSYNNKAKNFFISKLELKEFIIGAFNVSK